MTEAWKIKRERFVFMNHYQSILSCLYLDGALSSDNDSGVGDLELETMVAQFSTEASFFSFFSLVVNSMEAIQNNARLDE